MAPEDVGPFVPHAAGGGHSQQRQVMPNGPEDRMQQAVGQVPAMSGEEIPAGAQVMGFIVGGGFATDAGDAQNDKRKQQNEHRQPDFSGRDCGRF